MTTQRTWVETILQPLVVATMMACLAVSVVQVLQLLVPTWSGTYLTLIVFLTSLEAMAASRLVRRNRLRGKDLLSFRVGEWVLIVVALKLGSYVARGVGALLADIALWRQDIAYLFTIEYVIALLLTWFAWMIAGDIESDLAELGTLIQNVHIDRAGIQSRLMSRFFRGGMVLVVLAGLARIGVSQILNLAHPPVAGIILNVLLYFVLGLLLLSQAHLTVLQVRWRYQEIPSAADVGTRWSRVSLAFIVALAVIALLLPTSYSFGLIETLGLILGFVLEIAYFLAALLVLIFMLPFAFLLSLLGIGSGQRPSMPVLPTPPPFAAPPEAGGSSLWSLLRSLLFWGLILGIVIYTLRSYAGYRGGLGSGPRADSWLGRLWALLAGLWRQLRGAAAGAVEPIRRRLATVAPPEVLPDRPRIWRWRRLSSMSPRERIQYYYLSIVHRGEKVGKPRAGSETPYEYSAALREKAPEAEPDLTELTDAFIEARYSRHDIEDERAGLLKQSWNRIKRALRS